MDIKKGRPPIAKRRSRILVTLPDDDIATLKEFADATGTKPATFIREVVQIALPDIKALTIAVREAQTSTNNNVRDKGKAMLAKHIKNAEDLMDEPFNEK